MLTDKENVELARVEYQNIKKNGAVKINVDGKPTTIGFVVDKIDDATGQQAYVVADSQLPSNPTNEQLNAIKQTTILYRGSSFNVSLDAANDWLGNDAPMAGQIAANMFGNGGKVSNKPTPQLLAAARTLHSTMDKYPNASVFVYGQSLGSMSGQYAIADLSAEEQKRLIVAYLYEGPNIFPILTKKQQDNAKALNKLNKAFNFIDTKDVVTMGSYGRGISGSVGNKVFLDSKRIKNPVDQHMWGGYQYDKSGNIIVKTKYVSDYAKQVTQAEISRIEDLRKKMTKSSGGLSSSEKLFLDAMEARSVVKGMQLIVDTELGNLKKKYSNAITAAENLWRDTKQQAAIIGQHISSSEQLSALSRGGATEHNIKTQQVNDYQDSITEIKGISDDYGTLVGQITAAIESQVSTDAELAHEIEGLL
ncbi:hypothetical protein ESZ50_10925 [Weissella muntiaci]|uniref:DUF2974 domain-containing protein n=1 Tax=Weissella muntiaci TaxID=2508881 RepID=A0A6C2C2F0_9LACO|nr:hypothetical protein [Weissella muntiaci]TYC47859.1 hypothetical protein ESZ50_10925 [Weissella muntiaci]